ncbi:MAG: PilZ domain-containing protein [Candidatus Gastranaerophilales bacterium]|nr:PilZ domain-containing protein [Candidatus Gastranaerophilales bacterium]
MIDFLKKNRNLKIIPGNINKISNGTIIDSKDASFVVLLDKAVSLEQNEVIEVIIPDQSNLIKFESTVIQKEEKILYLTIPKNVRYVQRREFPRVNISIPVTLNEISNPDDTLNSITKNLSGGGMQVIADKTFFVGSLLKAKFIIFDKSSIESVLEVLRVDKKDHSCKEYYLSGRFKDLSNTQRTALIQMCFKRQLELKYKGIKLDLSNNGGECH